ncbi:MAG: DUF885 domain-containing protein [Flavobacteriaceae bacterium CG02_land_8_20_14_3_00_34_13]|nr:MAG: DUF885 domain-containing protein [Flavobacteriaceae bacterium CG02_land_8_20_14_3_00_34_13]PIZ06971.1 MAG: DUF885 domain-containing protein [Flavobacteriaceae bacterium CG_4_10_14_0_8_um_filter_34_31]PJC06760.1 MAG: DUF885 domain-containing protein [Flavobacteriaceae bacterium CG_4_9_14_0_8_um_filter_34_30]
MRKNSMLILFTTLLILGCKNETKEDVKPDVSAVFQSVLKNYYEEGLLLNPVQATMAGDNRFNDQFPNTLTDTYIDSLKNYYTKYKQEVAQFSDADLSETEQMSKAVLAWECDINTEYLSFNNNKFFPIDQMWSINLFFGQLASGQSAQPFKNIEDYNNWLKRTDGFVVWLSTAEERMKEGMAAGYVLPKSLIVKVIPQLEAMTNPDVEQHLFYAPIKNIPEDFSAEDKEALTKAYTAMISEKIIPTYQSLLDFMKTDYLEAGRLTSGIAETPNGKAYYEHQIKKYTTTDMSAEEIHELGLSEVARILSEMEKVKEQVGYKGEIKSFFDYVRNKKELMPFTDAQQIIDNFNAIHERMKPQLEKLFDKTPKTAFEVRQTEAFRENSASAEYNQGSLDGTRPGIFYTPIPDASKYNIYSDESLFLHEAIPGHHYQISLTQESKDLSDFRKVLWYSGYGEGWALYTESLGKELGLYTDPYQYFGMLGAEMHRAIRLVVDTGLHAKGWTREQAIQYSLDNEAESEEGIIAEIERYMANPGQALAYKIGQLKIRELRGKAEKELGEAFDIREFHNQVLETGCIPLSLLETKIANWINTSKTVQ